MFTGVAFIVSLSTVVLWHSKTVSAGTSRDSYVYRDTIRDTLYYSPCVKRVMGKIEAISCRICLLRYQKEEIYRCERNECMRKLILNLGTRRRWVVSFTLRPIYTWEKNAPCTLNRRRSEPQSLNEQFGKEIIALRLTSIKPRFPGSPPRSLDEQQIYNSACMSALSVAGELFDTWYQSYTVQQQ